MTNKPFSETIGGDLSKAIAQNLKTFAALASGLTRGATDLRPLPTDALFMALRDSMNKIGGELARIRAANRAAREKHADQLTEALDARARWVEAYALRKRVGAPSQKDRFVLAGRVADRATGLALANLVVEVSDPEKRAADVFGSTRTNALGYFRLDFLEEAFRSRFAKRPAIRVDVRDFRASAAETIVDSFAPKLGTAEFVDAAVDGTKFGVSLEQGRALRQSITTELERFAANKAVIESRLGLRSHKAPVPPAAPAESGARAAQSPAAAHGSTARRAASKPKTSRAASRAATVPVSSRAGRKKS